LQQVSTSGNNYSRGGILSPPVFGAVKTLQTSNPDDNTLIFTWDAPDNPTGAFLNYSISIINLSDGSIVRQENTVNTSIEESLGIIAVLLLLCDCIGCIHVVPGVPYNVSIAAVNGAGIGQVTTFVNFSQELGISYCACTPFLIGYCHA
jgi:hypothetical protein